jgi:hypothetical protein
MDLGSLMALPDRASWRVHHRKCDPRPNAASYWIAVEEARTHARLLELTAHLMESKDWLRHTDWDRLILRMANVDA